jgi:hypothetical protein
MANKTLYVRIFRKTNISNRMRGGIPFTQEWKFVTVDQATAQCIEEDALLEVSETEPVGFGAASAGDSADASTTGAGTDKPIKPDDAAEVTLAILAAINTLDKEDASLWTVSGNPKTEAISLVTGWPVTAVERDSALSVAE